MTGDHIQEKRFKTEKHKKKIIKGLFKSKQIFLFYHLHIQTNICLETHYL